MSDNIQHDTDMILHNLRRNILDLEANIKDGANVTVNDLETLSYYLSNIYHKATNKELEIA